MLATIFSVVLFIAMCYGLVIALSILAHLVLGINPWPRPQWGRQALRELRDKNKE